MKKTIISLFFSAFFLTSCVTAVRSPLKGSYMDKPFIVSTDKSFDEVWSKVIDIFATKGFSIKVIDKSSGLIVTEDYSFLNSYTFETPDGKLKDPNAWLVCSNEYFDSGGFARDITPAKISGNWNIRLKSENNKTIININITNLKANRHFPASKYSPEYDIEFDVKSTGKFEEQFVEQIK